MMTPPRISGSFDGGRPTRRVVEGETGIRDVAIFCWDGGVTRTGALFGVSGAGGGRHYAQ